MGIHFQKICTYYSTSIRQNQLFFATFSSEIANSSLCTNNPCAIRHILVSSDKSIFQGGISPVLSCKTAGFPLLCQTAGKRRLCGTEGFAVDNRYLFNFFVPLRLQPCRLRPAFCSFSITDFHVFPRIARFSPGCRGLTGFSAGTPSIPRSRPAPCPEGSVPSGSGGCGSAGRSSCPGSGQGGCPPPHRCPP